MDPKKAKTTACDGGPLGRVLLGGWNDQDNSNQTQVPQGFRPSLTAVVREMLADRKGASGFAAEALARRLSQQIGGAR